MSTAPRVVAVAFALTLAAPAFAQQRTVTGLVVDVACSVARAAASRNETHAACAMACARNGDRMAILTDDVVYLVEGNYTANANAKLLDFVAKRVEAKGHVVEKDGVTTINVLSMALVREPD